MKTLVIAGATGGIGRALVMEALLRWPEVQIWALGRDYQKLLDLKNGATHAERLHIFPIQLDELLSSDLLKDQMKSELGSIDLAIYAIGVLNAGGDRPEKNLREVQNDNLAETFRINAAGAMDFAKLIKPLMRHSGIAKFIALSAKVGSIGDNNLGGWYSYRMSKAALNMGMRNVALEFQRSGCHSIVAAVHPGTTLTPFSKDYVSHWEAGRVSTVDVTASRVLDLCEKLEEKDNGAFLHWDGTTLPW